MWKSTKLEINKGNDGYHRNCVIYDKFKYIYHEFDHIHLDIDDMYLQSGYIHDNDINN